MIAAEDEPVAGEPQCIGKMIDKAAEISGGHTGITAKLINLIGGRFNEQGRMVCLGKTNGGLQYQWMRGAHRVNTIRFTLFVSHHQLCKMFHFPLQVRNQRFDLSFCFAL